MNVAEEWNAVTDGGFLEASDFVKYCKEENGGHWAFFTWWAAFSGRIKKQKEEEEKGGRPKPFWPHVCYRIVRGSDSYEHAICHPASSTPPES